MAEKKYIRQPFFFLWMIYFLMGVSLLFLYSKKELFLKLNAYHSKGLDSFFALFTELGNGLFSVAVFLLAVIFRKISLAVQIITAYLFSGLLVQILKRIFKMPRPKAFFGPGEYAWFIDGVTHGGSNSFPSGHTASAFALATILSLYSKSKYAGILYFLLAAAVGYSRVYLGQHFFTDVFAGAVIGVIAALLVWIFLRNKDFNKILQRSKT